LRMSIVHTRPSAGNFLLNQPRSGLRSCPTTLLSSSVVERSAVNRLVVGSNPTSGASFFVYSAKISRALWLVRLSGYDYVPATEYTWERVCWGHARTPRPLGLSAMRAGSYLQFFRAFLAAAQALT
jgi:hypothetical protein